MKKIAISTLAVLIACPAFAGNPRDGSSWQIGGMNPYIGLRGGIAYTNTNYNFLDTKESMTDVTFQGRVAMGLEIDKQYRSEIEWSIFSKAKDSSEFGGQNVEVKTNLQTLLMNTYYEFGHYHEIRPFAGLGLGVGFADIDRSGATITSHSSDKAGFSASALMGVTFDMEQFAVDIAARYTYVDVVSGLHNFGGDIGIRFMF
jgi:opacity protein-like surface antigen